MLYKITFCLSTHYTPKWQLVLFLEITCKNTLFLALLQAKNPKKKKSNLVSRAVVHTQKPSAGVSACGACWGDMCGAVGHWIVYLCYGF